MGMLKASRMTGPGSTLGLGLYSNFYSKKAAVEASTALTHCVRAPYPLQPLQPLQLYSISTVYSLYTTPLCRSHETGTHTASKFRISFPLVNEQCMHIVTLLGTIGTRQVSRPSHPVQL